jgi:type 1 fimbriae regulatory protein FimB/type 1 fimbriae regulatory protein FimE
MGKSAEDLRVVPVNGKVPPRRLPNAERRPREYLTKDEITRLIKAASSIGRHRHRDATLIVLTFRHGLGVSEVVALQWRQVDLKKGVLHVERIKNGLASVQRLSQQECHMLTRLQREYPHTTYVFSSERKTPLTTASVRKMFTRAGEMACLGFPVHPQQLRYSTGVALAGDGIDPRALQRYMGHTKIEYARKYARLDDQDLPISSQNETSPASESTS